MPLSNLWEFIVKCQGSLNPKDTGYYRKQHNCGFKGFCVFAPRNQICVVIIFIFLYPSVENEYLSNTNANAIFNNVLFVHSATTKGLMNV